MMHSKLTITVVGYIFLEFVQLKQFRSYMLSSEISAAAWHFRVFCICISLPSFVLQRYLKAHFSYNPHKDSRISAPALGLEFEPNDILEIVKVSGLV